MQGSFDDIDGSPRLGSSFELTMDPFMDVSSTPTLLANSGGGLPMENATTTIDMMMSDPQLMYVSPTPSTPPHHTTAPAVKKSRLSLSSASSPQQLSSKSRKKSSQQGNSKRTRGPLIPDTIKMEKAPDAPRRFKSAYMFFSMHTHKTLREHLLQNGHTKINTTDIAKLVSKAWKSSSADERKKWHEMAHADKKRYDAERKAYKGPWKVPSISALAACKDPTAPKRPMSAFLAFSGEKRKAVRDQHRHLTNADVTRLLGRMWNELPVVERRVYLDEEARLRKAYKVALADWKKNKQIHMLAKQEEDDDKKKKLDGSSDSKVKAKQQLMSKSSVNSAGVLMKIEPKADPCIPHCAHNQPMSGFETRMAEATFGKTQSPSFGTRLGRKSDTLMSKESPASISTSVGHNPSKQSWNDWHWQESRQDISTDDRMTIPPIDGPSYFPYHSTVVYVDRRPYSMIPEEREGIRSVHSARTYPTSYNSTVDLPYSYAPPYQRKSGNVATDGYLQNRSVYSERWHCSDRPVSANYYSDMGSHGMRDEFYLGSNHAYDSRMM